MQITNRERLVAAMYFQQPWAGTELELDEMLATFEALDLGSLDHLFEAGAQGGVNMRKTSDVQDSDRLRMQVELPVLGTLLLLRGLPAWACPAKYGPAKVRLLRKLRQMVGPEVPAEPPAEEPPVEEQPPAPPAEPTGSPAEVPDDLPAPVSNSANGEARA
jgi:hypothetical protein